MRLHSLVCAALITVCGISQSYAADTANATHNPFERADSNQNSNSYAKQKAAAAKKIASTSAVTERAAKKASPPPSSSGKPLSAAQKKALAQKKAAEKAKSEAPFIRGNYVLTGHLPVNGYHKGQPVVVIVDKGSHFTHVLQLQGKKICRVLTISNSIGTADTPTPPGPYTVTGKKKLPTWVPPKSIDPKQKPVPPYNQTRKNPLGVAAIYLNKFEINLHGTNQQNSIRKSVSHGCVRHSNKDISTLYNMVNRGDRVYIVNKFRGKVIHRSDFT